MVPENVFTITPTIPPYNVGRIGEQLASYYLEHAGVECSVVDRRGSDVWAHIPGGEMFSLEVKTAQELSVRENAYKDRVYTNSYYSYSVRSQDAQEYAFVALDLQLMRILNKRELWRYSKSHMFHFKPDFFSRDALEMDLLRLHAKYA